MGKRCKMCGGEGEHVYDMNSYHILQCRNCRTSFVMDMPSPKDLQNYYNGFQYCIDTTNKDIIISDAIKNWFAQMGLPKNARMLDIGGGNGYFSLAFEHFGFGKATYIDLDAEACNYVKTLGIAQVINDDIKNISKYTNNKFDLIYSRHVIEHIIDPTEFIDNAIPLLADDGIFVLQCPNGNSHERICDINYFKSVFKNIKESNNYNNFKTFFTILSDKFASDIAPPRHLWAISGNGLKKYLKNIPNIDFKIYTKSSRDKVYSPYLYKSSLIYKKYHLYNFVKFTKSILRQLCIYILGGKRCHLVVVIKKHKKA